MKFIILVLGLALCLTTTLTIAASTTTSSAMPIPAKIDGYTAYSLEQVKGVKAILNPFISYSVSVVINAVNSKKFAPESYSFFLRKAFRKSVFGVHEILYYYRAYNPRNKSGKIYYGTFNVFWPSVTGYKAKFLGYTVDKAVKRA